MKARSKIALASAVLLAALSVAAGAAMTDTPQHKADGTFVLADRWYLWALFNGLLPTTSNDEGAAR